MAEFRYRIAADSESVIRDGVPVIVTSFIVNGYSEFIKALDSTYKLNIFTDPKSKYIISSKNFLKKIKYIFYHPEINKENEDEAITIYNDIITIYKYNFTSLSEILPYNPSSQYIQDLDTFMRTLLD